MPKRTDPLARYLTQLHGEGDRGEKSFQALVQHGYDIIAILNEAGAIQYASPALERLLGHSARSATGKQLADWVSEEHRVNLTSVLTEAQGNPGQPQSLLFQFAHKNGSWRLLEGTVRHLGRELKVPGIVFNAHDITEQRAAEEQILSDAMLDTLTGLPNRSLFLDRLVCTNRQRKKEKLYAVLYTSLDQFGAVSGSLGGAAADNLLVQLAKRLEECLRSGDTVARTSESEFALLLDEIRDISDATRVASRIHDRLKFPFSIGGQDVFTTASIGIALSSTAHARPEELLRDAELAMHRAQGMPGTPYLMFDPAMHDKAIARLQLEGDLRRALERKEFFCTYQPIQLIEGGTLAGFEALVRWQHPTRGRVTPGEFIQVAEETGLIVPLGKWVLNEACRQLREWQQQESGAQGLTMSVNASVKQLAQPKFVDAVMGILRGNSLEPGSLRIEITESVVMDFDAALAVLKELRAQGVHLAMDDFGTGYSSLSYLSRLPVSMLKIDRSFVSKSGDGLSDPELVRSVMAIAASLNLGVTAEGIETESQLSELRTLACSYGQGYYLGKPLDADQALALIRKQPARAN